ncbi:SAGA complex subunit Hfi1 [Schizosaccharomyces japonicus yFS275]|uniref:SAGA complex subunit Hfi1 n=1 Tax=Schizosaccharomyces japonicus (strain yFS275 / FY16936) TaxID=402676 RepID=B6K509_SCHJY|nr:SAGA complex subunit Hfi1 [Schizosaccharomyces japonicus yFS275]EEB08613.2 SAGA complex subunit Hfi1 [Schizosaccharomyces japonicus yFS275]
MEANKVNSEMGTNTQTKQKKQQLNERYDSKRAQGVMSKQKQLLGDDFEMYTTMVTDFLIGQANRNELNKYLKKFLKNPKFVKLHNTLILEILKSLRNRTEKIKTDVVWVKRKKSDAFLLTHNRFVAFDNKQALTLKKIILSFNAKDRARIKAAIEDNRNITPLPSIPSESWVAKLPKIPVSQDKLNSVFVNDIKAGYVAPLSSETLELPDQDVLKTRITAIALENGLLGGIQKDVPAIILAGLESHLKNLFAKCLSIVNKNLRQTSEDEAPRIGIHDINLAWQVEPHALIEPFMHPRRLQCLVNKRNATDEAKIIEEVPVHSPSSSQSERWQVAKVLDEVLSVKMP